MQLGVSSQSDDWFMWFKAWKKKKTSKARRIYLFSNKDLWIPPLNKLFNYLFFWLGCFCFKILPNYSSTILYLPIAVGFHNIWKEMLRQGSYHPNKNNRDIFFKKMKIIVSNSLTKFTH